MTAGVIGAGERSAALRAAQAYTVRVATDWPSAAGEWDAALAAGAATPFQRGPVMAAWHAAMAGRSEIEPLVVTIVEAGSGAHALSLALIRVTFGRRRTIGFADLGLIDYNCPIVGPAAPRDAAGARALWRTLLKALPAADLIDLRKMPPEIGGRPNPLALLGAIPCALTGNIVLTGDDWAAYHAGLKRTDRKELERSWRVFSRHDGAEFRPIADPAERRAVLAAIEAQQPLRMQATGKSYALDAPSAAAFYRNLIESPASDGAVVVTALTAGDEVVAALIGLADAEDYIMVRISNAEGRWANASPGKVIIDQSMAWLHGQGRRRFDFSIGEYDYKRRFAVAPTPLVDLVAPLGWRGLAEAASTRAKDWLRRRPALRKAAARLLGRAA